MCVSLLATCHLPPAICIMMSDSDWNRGPSLTFRAAGLYNAGVDSLQHAAWRALQGLMCDAIRCMLISTSYENSSARLCCGPRDKTGALAIAALWIARHDTEGPLAGVHATQPSSDRLLRTRPAISFAALVTHAGRRRQASPSSLSLSLFLPLNNSKLAASASLESAASSAAVVRSSASDGTWVPFADADPAVPREGAEEPSLFQKSA